jgi:hypothetical protein
VGVPVLKTVKSFLAQFGGCANLEYSQIISGTDWWMCQFGIRSNHLWHSLVDVPIWNSVARFVAQFSRCASFEYGQIISGTVWWVFQFGIGQKISGTVWWMCQFGIRSNNFWHSVVDVPIWNTVK